MRHWLEALRNEQNLSMQQMADKLNISLAYYSMIESGKRQKKMDIAILSRLASALNVPIERIIAYETERG